MFATPQQKANNYACASRGVTASADGEAGRSAILEASCRIEASKGKPVQKGKFCTNNTPFASNAAFNKIVCLIKIKFIFCLEYVRILKILSLCIN